METFWLKSEDGRLAPANEESEEWLAKKRIGTPIRAKTVAQRNYEFLKKFMSLVRTIHDQLPPALEIEFMNTTVTPMQPMEATRKWLTIKAGYFDVYGYPDGSVRTEAKSIAFANMEEEEFEKLYSAVIDVGLGILPKDWTAERLDDVARELISYS